MTENHRKWLAVLAFLIFIVFSVLVSFYIGIPMIRLAKEPEGFRDWVDGYGIWSRLLFVGMGVLQVIIALIPGEPLELAAGYAFGVVEGSLLCMAGFLAGSWLVFTAVRCLGPKLITVFFPEKEIRQLSFLKDPRKARVLTFILMTVPGTPKDLLSYFAGLTPLRIGQWLGIVAVARIPSLVTSTVSGAAAGEQNYLLASAVLVFTLLLSGLGILYYKKLCADSAEAEK